ncbi:MAG: cation diffusion facilitator family transporter [Flavobacteriales bacterium]
MAHDHAHAHDHAGRDHAKGSGNLRLAFFFNLAFTLIEVAGGFWTNSLAVLSDAMHDMGDVLVLGAAWYLSHLAVRGRDAKYSYGYGRYSMLGGWLTALVLAIGSLVLMIFTLSRMNDVHEPFANGMIILGVFGLAMNGFAAWKLHGGSTLNERGAYLHLLEDVLGWAAVLVGAVVIRFTGLGHRGPTAFRGHQPVRVVQCRGHLAEGHGDPFATAAQRLQRTGRDRNAVGPAARSWRSRPACLDAGW